MNKIKKIVKLGALALALTATVASAASAGSFIVSTYTYSGTNIRGIEATTTLSGYSRTHCEAEDANSYSYRSQPGYDSSYSYAEVVHNSGTLYRSAWYTR